MDIFYCLLVDHHSFLYLFKIYTEFELYLLYHLFHSVGFVLDLQQHLLSIGI